jgi:tetratricopeptide (TPR) repeat protein
LDADERKKNYQASIQMANKAVGLDLGDSKSWYVLGNAHLTNFFMNNESTTELENALKAYGHCEKNLKEPNPDLFFNRATIYEYLERYNEAIRDFQYAQQVDPSLGANKKIESIVGFVSRAYNSIISKGKLKSNNLKRMVKSIPQELPEMTGSFKICDISQL